MPRPYKALQKQGYKHYFTALTGRTRIAIIHSKTSVSVIAGEARRAIRRGFYYGVPWRAATTAMLSENTQRAFNGRGVPRPYKALRRQGYRRDFTALTGRTRIGIIHSKTSLSVIAGEACLARRVMTCIIRIACDYFMV